MVHESDSSKIMEEIYSKFEREINGKIRKFWVQRLPDDQKQLAIEYFCKYFIRDEPMAKSLKIIADEECMKYCRELWWSLIQQNKCLACFTELDNGQNQMVAVNLCYQASTHEKIKVDDAPQPLRGIYDDLEYISNLKDISKVLGTTEYLGALGLVVIPEYRGYKVGLPVLEARKVLCEKLGLRASVTFFTGPASQGLAEKAGFKDLVSITYDDLQIWRPESKYPNINEYSKSIRNMYILY